MPISVISLLMILAGSYGSSTADPVGFLIVVVAPAASVVGGIGLLRRRPWARYYVIGLLILLIATNAWQLVAGRPETTTYTSSDGVKTTVETSYGSGGCYQIPMIGLCALLLAGLCWPSVRDEFRTPKMPSTALPGAPAADAKPLPAAAPTEPAAAAPSVAERDWRDGVTISKATRGQRWAMILVIVILLSIAGGMAWLVSGGIASGSTHFPSQRPSTRRIVTRQQEPATFWLAIGTYFVLGLGSGAAGLWMIRQACRRNP